MYFIFIQVVLYNVMRYVLKAVLGQQTKRQRRKI